MTDEAGNTPQAHEGWHGTLIASGWSMITQMAEEMTSLPCMCKSRAKCFRNAFNDLFVDAMKKWCEADNYQFDCKVYHPGPLKVEKCALANTTALEATHLLLAFANRLAGCYLM
jgi:hypothetical protein